MTSQLVLEILGNMCIAMICSPAFDVINFETNLIVSFFLIKPFFYMTKETRQKFKYLENEKRNCQFLLSVAKNCHRP